MSENDRTVKALVLQLLQDADPQRMTGEERGALKRLVDMVWRWDTEDRL